MKKTGEVLISILLIGLLVVVGVILLIVLLRSCSTLSTEKQAAMDQADWDKKPKNPFSPEDSESVVPQDFSAPPYSERDASVGGGDSLAKDSSSGSAGGKEPGGGRGGRGSGPDGQEETSPGTEIGDILRRADRVIGQLMGKSGEKGKGGPLQEKESAGGAGPLGKEGSSGSAGGKEPGGGRGGRGSGPDGQEETSPGAEIGDLLRRADRLMAEAKGLAEQGQFGRAYARALQAWEILRPWAPQDPNCRTRYRQLEDMVRSYGDQATHGNQYLPIGDKPFAVENKK